MLVTKRGKEAALADVYRYRGMSRGNFPRVGTPGCDPRTAERSNDKHEHGASMERASWPGQGWDRVPEHYGSNDRQQDLKSNIIS